MLDPNARAVILCTTIRGSDPVAEIRLEKIEDDASFLVSHPEGGCTEMSLNIRSTDPGGFWELLDFSGIRLIRVVDQLAMEGFIPLASHHSIGKEFLAGVVSDIRNEHIIRILAEFCWSDGYQHALSRPRTILILPKKN